MSRNFIKELNKPATDSIYSAVEVTNWFIRKYFQKKKKINQLKLMNLVYMSQGLNLEKNKHPLFIERIEAWACGPVIDILYHEFKKIGLGNLSLKDLIVDHASRRISFINANNPEIKIVEKIWESTHDISSTTISAWIKKKDNAWHKEWVMQEDPQNHIMNEHRIGKDFVDFNQEFATEKKRKKNEDQKKKENL